MDGNKIADRVSTIKYQTVLSDRVLSIIISWTNTGKNFLELHQLNLFAGSPIEPMLASKSKLLAIGAQALVQWKSQIYN